MAKKNNENPFIVSYEGSFCNKCKKFFNSTKTNYCPSCNICSEDLCIIAAIVDAEPAKEKEEVPIIKSITCDAIQGYLKERKFYESKVTLSKGEQYLKIEMLEEIKKEVGESFGYIPQSNFKLKNKK